MSRRKLNPVAEQAAIALAEGMEPAPRKMTLVEIVDNICALCELVETAETDEERKAARSELERSVVFELSEKVDGIGWFKKRTEQQIDALKQAKREICADVDRGVSRLEERWERVRALARYALTVNKVPAFRGQIYTISLCGGRSSVSITDEALVPDRFKVVTVRMRAEVWDQVRMLPVTADLGDGRTETTPVDDNVRDFSYCIDREALRQALDAKEVVEGAELCPGEDYVRVA